MFELIVKIKDSNRKYSKEFPLELELTEYMHSCINNALKEFNAESRPDSVKIVIKSEEL